MTQAFVGQIQPFAIDFAPRNWAQCNGQILSISQNTALFSLLGTMYGGNGSTTFGLPNLQSRVAVHFGTSPFGTYSLGEAGGQEAVTIDINTMPAHTHPFHGSATQGTDTQPDDGSVLANVANGRGETPAPYYAPDTTPQILNPGSIAITGGNQAHTNLQPYQVINWCICMFGVYPSRS